MLEGVNTVSRLTGYFGIPLVGGFDGVMLVSQNSSMASWEESCFTEAMTKAWLNDV